ncbi:Succinate-semialdehyde dehydrogenase [NADP(+)] 1 [Corynebacterium atrinae]|uniref:NAD-dependent succinate-semialdehyde dehydrogenase n=1 Tax=Corynebacterium atrinae TaxID=1336740 RepID=UPI0025B346B2|nr:NAD-dependent succinate-semialdehyde dehydrogenase [Corynebacterium atrinae]WJY62856.1 Succinate-semialdehyde dehydrogenase [NADP(+)] 1 [Corynebacterium atrinae]
MSTKETGYRVESPATGEVLERFPTATDAEVAAAVESAHSAYRDWSALDISERASAVHRAADLFESRKQELAEIISREMGKPISEGIEEAEFSAAILRYYADNGAQFTADQAISTADGATAMIKRRPIGALLGIMPWNFPYYQIARFAGPNLMLGNTIVLKHAEICPTSAQAVDDIFRDAGVPVGGYVNVFASHDQIATIIADPRIQGVSLTGSERAGSIIASLAGKHLKKAVLELGGSDPYVVLDTDDVTAAAQLAWSTRMYNTGQACNSNKRLIVMDDIYDDFVAELVRLAEAMEPGSPDTAGPSVYMPLSSRSAAEGLNAQVQKAVEEGATLRAGGVLGDAAFFSPAVITDITPDMESHHVEFFGPVAVVYRVSSDDEALAVANDSPFGLGGAVFSRDQLRAEKIARELEVGMANVNTPAGEGAELPFGGVKRSGYGRELGPLGMDEFVNKQLYYVQK